MSRASKGVPQSSCPLDSSDLAADPERACCDEPARATALVRAHHAFVWRLLLRFGVSEADADDAAQRVFLVACRRLGDIREGAERSFLASTALRVASATRRRSVQRHEIPSEMEDHVDGAPTPDEAAEQAQALRLLDQVLARMPEPLRDVLVLADIEGFTVPELAQLHGVPLGTMATRLRRARQEFLTCIQRLKAATKGRQSRWVP